MPGNTGIAFRKAVCGCSRTPRASTRCKQDSRRRHRPRSSRHPDQALDDAESSQDGEARRRDPTGTDGSAEGDSRRGRVPGRRWCQLPHRNHDLCERRSYAEQSRAVSGEGRCQLTTTSSSSGAALAVAHWRAISLLPEAHTHPGTRRLPKTRGPELGRQGGVRWQPYISPDTWYDTDTLSVQADCRMVHVRVASAAQAAQFKRRSRSFSHAWIKSVPFSASEHRIFTRGQPKEKGLRLRM